MAGVLSWIFTEVSNILLLDVLFQHGKASNVNVAIIANSVFMENLNRYCVKIFRCIKKDLVITKSVSLHTVYHKSSTVLLYVGLL